MWNHAQTHTHTHSTSASLSLRSNHPLVPSMDCNWACSSSTLCCRPSSSLLRAYNTQQCFKHTHTFYIPLFFILLLLSLFFTISILNPISPVSVSRRVTKRRVASAYDMMSWHREKIKQLRVDALLNMEATGSVWELVFVYFSVSLKHYRGLKMATPLRASVIIKIFHCRYIKDVVSIVTYEAWESVFACSTLPWQSKLFILTHTQKKKKSDSLSNDRLIQGVHILLPLIEMLHWISIIFLRIGVSLSTLRKIRWCSAPCLCRCIENAP